MDLPIQDLAMSLQRAERAQAPLQPFSEVYPALSSAQAYAIQQAWLSLKQAEGGSIVGRKIGLTSKAMQQQLGVDQPDYGFLLNTMVVQPGSTIALAELIQPRIEPEIAFWLAEDLRGPGITVEHVLRATRGVSASFELVDSRIANWRIKLVDTIADNASSARVIASEQIVALDGLDLSNIHVTLKCNGATVEEGVGSAVLGHPAAAVAWLANKLAEFEVSLLAGQLILPGAMCAAVSVASGDTFQASFSQLGDITLSFS
ncbi:2-keto-4-pentenoate hydratase [Ktedonosporobacter rubrisoli]|uniref:2-keto-4-pentenoate hydratase n=1 Tax=Ktedonosporobacter rubrisoli TaxID=2509675 RepID=A0A4P6JN38_KTERU|nr:2-keto-4-pentenoate hydratase [Ktedonosporobacter rubrisoli]QBD76685.1 2-keto-4-pentenoate hydratase [Ktedonosporobacter rubrisoli]